MSSFVPVAPTFAVTPDHYPPLGSSKAGAIVCSIAFFIGGILVLRHMIATKYRVYEVYGAGAIFRGIASAVRAATIFNGHTNRGEAVVYTYFLNAGWGMSVATQAMTVAGWIKNTPAPVTLQPQKFWSTAIKLIFPLALTCGPGLGLPSALCIYVSPSTTVIDNGRRLRKALVSIVFGFACITFLTALTASLKALAQGNLKGSKGRLAPHTSILAAAIGDLLLVWAGAVQVANTLHQNLGYNDNLFYPLLILPELLQLVLWCIPGLMARVNLSHNFAEWYAAQHQKKPRNPPLQTVFDDDTPATRKEAGQQVAAEPEGSYEGSGSSATSASDHHV